MPCSSPSIVASQNFLNQTATSSGTTTPITLFTPASAGLFRVSVYITSTAHTVGDNGIVTVNIEYNDGIYGSATDFQPFENNNGIAAAQPFILNSIWCASGQPIKIFFATSYSGGTAFVYNAYTVIEQLA